MRRIPKKARAVEAIRQMASATASDVSYYTRKMVGERRAAHRLRNAVAASAGELYISDFAGSASSLETIIIDAVVADAAP